MKDVLSLLENPPFRLSKGQRVIAQYIRESYEQAAFMTAAVLGKTVGVSESTVVRFATELGFDGYPALQKALQERLMDRLPGGEAEPSGDAQDLVSTVLRRDMELLRRTEPLVDRLAFSSAVEALLAARQVWLVGTPTTGAVAAYLSHYLQQSLQQVHLLPAFSGGALPEQLADADRRDVLIAIDGFGQEQGLGSIAAYCRSKGVCVLGLTDSALSPLGRSSDHVLLAKSEETFPLTSVVASMSLANALILGVAAQREDALRARAAELQRMRAYHRT